MAIWIPDARRSEDVEALPCLRWGVTGTTGASIGTEVELENRSKMF